MDVNEKGTDFVPTFPVVMFDSMVFGSGAARLLETLEDFRLIYAGTVPPDIDISETKMAGQDFSPSDGSPADDARLYSALRTFLETINFFIMPVDGFVHTADLLANHFRPYTRLHREADRIKSQISERWPEVASGGRGAGGPMMINMDDPSVQVSVHQPGGPLPDELIRLFDQIQQKANGRPRNDN